MTATIPFVNPISQISLAPGSIVTVPGLSWQEFESILQQLGSNRSARLVFYQGTLEIMVPLPEHERPKELIADIIKILLRKSSRSYEPFGSTTFKQEGLAGVEPDACFYIKNYQTMIDRRRLQANDPPPDLAVEIDVTAKTNLEAYQAIKVPELWVYDGSGLTIYLLQGHKYSASDVSPTFPNIPLLSLIPAIIEQSWQIGTVGALAEFEALIGNLRK